MCRTFAGAGDTLAAAFVASLVRAARIGGDMAILDLADVERAVREGVAAAKIAVESPATTSTISAALSVEAVARQLR